MTSVIVLAKVEAALRRLGECAEPHGGLLPSVRDIDGGERWCLPAAVSGQRQSDRSFPGSNLMHDHSVLQAMLGLSRAGRGSDFAEMAQGALRRFVIHCSATESGLFPWGEHAFWNLADDCPGNSYALEGTADALKHDHLLQAPVWLWDEIGEISELAVVRFAEGLDNHWRTNEPREYNRHAALGRRGRVRNNDATSCDFPRHSGFYILDWAVALRRSGRVEIATQIRDMLDYWWGRRRSSGLLPLASRFPGVDKQSGRLAILQTASLGVSLLEAAEELDGGYQALAADCRLRGESYLRATLGVPHDPLHGRIVASWDGIQPEHARWWGSVYGDHTVATFGLLLLRAGAFLPRWEEAWTFCAEVAESYPLLPRDELIPAKDAGQVISFLTELFRCTGDERWRDKAWTVAGQAAEAFLDRALPRAAIGLDWYESQMLPGYLLGALGRLCCLESDAGVAEVWPADWSLR